MQSRTWKDQLQEFKRTDKVTELRNEKEITRAIQCVEEILSLHVTSGRSDKITSESQVLVLKDVLELVKNVGLGQTKDKLSTSIDHILETMQELDQASLDLLAGGEEQIRELTEHIDATEPEKMLRQVLEQLEYRKSESERAGPVQAQWEDDETTLQSRIRQLESQLSFPGCENALQKRTEKNNLEQKLREVRAQLLPLRESVLKNRKVIEQLEFYETALKTVNEGLPKEILHCEFKTS